MLLFVALKSVITRANKNKVATKMASANPMKRMGRRATPAGDCIKLDTLLCRRHRLNRNHIAEANRVPHRKGG